MTRAERIEQAAQAWVDAMDRWRGPESDSADGWEKCSREADDTEAALRTALALPREPAPEPVEGEHPGNAFVWGRCHNRYLPHIATARTPGKRWVCDGCGLEAGKHPEVAVWPPVVPGADRYAEGGRAGVLAAREYLRQVWDDGEQGNGDDAAELVLLRKFAEGPVQDIAPAREKEGGR